MRHLLLNELFVRKLASEVNVAFVMPVKTCR
jgi:hypothetical protein